MSKTKLRTGSPTSTRVETQEPDVKFKEGDRATINSTHPLFPSMSCTVIALPSPDAAIIELESGARERLLLKYLEPLVQDLQQEEQLKCDMKSAPVIEIALENSGFSPEGNHSHDNDFEILEPLSPDEERERHRLELKVERAFIESAAALRLLRDRRLYRDTHPNDFMGYCRDRFGKTKQAVNYLISALEVYENLTTTNCCRVLPTNEYQCRELSKLPLPKQPTAWNCAVDENDGKVPSGRIVKGVVERLKEKPLYQAKDFCFVGDVFILSRLEGDERKYNGYPCVAVELKHFTINVDVYDATLAVKPENLKKIDSPDVCRQLPAIINRIKRVRSTGQLDRGANSLLKHLGQQMYLTEVEEGLLQWLENHYNV